MFNNFFSENRAVYEIMLKKMVEPYRPQMTIWRMPFACWITTARDTISEYVIFNALPPQNDYANAPQCYVIPTVPVFYYLLPFLTSILN